MPVISITTWPTPEAIKQKMMEAVTHAVHTVSGAPLDKITVYVQEIEKKNWSDAGVMGSDPDFVTRSRRSHYEQGDNQ